ncbi:MAG: 3'-5' exonuclease [Verrucomicrobiota bacterium]
MDCALPIAQQRFCAIDFESSRASGQPLEVGLFLMEHLEWRPDLAWGRRLASPSTPDAPSLVSLWPDLVHRLRDRVVVAYGAGTEKRFLRTFPLHGFGPWIDVLPLARSVLPALPRHRLSDVVAALGLQASLAELLPQGAFHEALFDAAACLLVLRDLIARCQLSEQPLELLFKPDLSQYYQQAERRSP